jgi:hypothetical protein
MFRWKLPTKQRKANGNADCPLPRTLFRMVATMLTQPLWSIATGCTSKRATITKQSKQDRSGVFGDITGIAPGYSLSLGYEQIEFFTQGEYFFDAGTRSGNFFYSWSELSCAPVTWFRAGIVIDRTKALGSNFEVRRGPLVGFRYKKIDFTTYWLSPGSRDSTFIFTVALNF